MYNMRVLEGGSGSSTINKRCTLRLQCVERYPSVLLLLIRYMYSCTAGSDAVLSVAGSPCALPTAETASLAASAAAAAASAAAASVSPSTWPCLPVPLAGLLLGSVARAERNNEPYEREAHCRKADLTHQKCIFFVCLTSSPRAVQGGPLRDLTGPQHTS